jgi:uncharacterized OB-fold protein
MEGAMMTGQPIAEGLFTWPTDEPQLLGARCRDCAATTFPSQSGCPRCTGRSMDVVTLPREGVLWSWTVQGFRPKDPYIGPKEFAPYGVGYVDLGDVIVESRLSEHDRERLAIGQRMRLAIVPFVTDDPDAHWLTFEFGPVNDSDEGE